MKKSRMLTLIGIAAVPGGLVGLAVYYMLTKCWHKFTWPRTKQCRGCHIRQTYTVCIVCGKEYEYDTDKMKVGRELTRDWHSNCLTSGRAIRLDGSMGKTEEGIEEPDTHIWTPPTFSDTSSR